MTQNGAKTFATPKLEEVFRPGYYIEFSNPLWYLIARTKDIFARSGRNGKAVPGQINWRRLVNPMYMGSLQLANQKVFKEKKISSKTEQRNAESKA
uniref:Uncharacterized protein n=1 Tax=Plectus sambesii TaxID=2011161 RepID=A0A914X0V9_9BILA